MVINQEGNAINKSKSFFKNAQQAWAHDVRIIFSFNIQHHTDCLSPNHSSMADNYLQAWNFQLQRQTQGQGGRSLNHAGNIAPLIYRGRDERQASTVCSRNTAVDHEVQIWNFGRHEFRG